MIITRHEDGTVSQVGGVTRVTHGAAPQEDRAASAQVSTTSTRVGGTVTRFNGLTGEAVSTSGHVQYRSDVNRPNPSGSVMQSIRTEGGSKTVELVPGDPSSRTLLSVAVREGLVVETAPGIFTDRVAPGQPLQAADQTSRESKEQAEDNPLADTIYDPKEMDIWSQEIADIPQHSYDGAVAGVTAALASANPDKLEGVISSLAQSAGLEPEQAREYVETGVEWHAASIARDLEKSLGMSPEQIDRFWDQFRDKPHPRLAEAIGEVVNTGRADVFRELALDFKRRSAQATDMTAFHKAGFESRVDRDTGDILVRLGQGPWLPLSQLAKK
jgi:hypothetical protein